MTYRVAPGRFAGALSFVAATLFAVAAMATPPTTVQPARTGAARGGAVVRRAGTTRLGRGARATVVATTVAEALRSGAPVPHREQAGPTCGLYALGMVMDHYREAYPTAQNPLVVAQDETRAGSHSIEPNSRDLILVRAQWYGFTTTGGMFSAHELARLARHYGYRTVVMHAPTVQDIDASLDRHHPVMIAFDVDGQGAPANLQGARAHWAVLQGHYEADGVDHVVATHGWDLARNNLSWRTSDLLASSAQMRHNDYPRAELQDMSQLRSYAIEFLPPARARAVSRSERPFVRAMLNAADNRANEASRR